MRHRALLLLAIASLSSLAGCANVQPWERGNLARPEMAFDTNPGAAAVMQHTYSSKEGASGGYGVGGGGCGCN